MSDDNIRHINKLDKMRLFLRKGQLQVNPRKLQVKVILSVILKGELCKSRNSDMQYQLNCFSNSYMRYYGTECGGEHTKEFNTFYKYYTTKKFRVDKDDFQIKISKRNGANRYESVTLLDCNVQREWDAPKAKYVKLGSKWVGHYGANINKLVTPEELAELDTEKTPKEWIRFVRTIRKRVTKLVFTGGLRGTLNQCDKLKTHKDHDALMANVKEKLSGLEEAIKGFRGMSQELASVLIPMVKVQPYEGMRYALERIENNVESILSEIEGIKED